MFLCGVLGFGVGRFINFVRIFVSFRCIFGWWMIMLIVSFLIRNLLCWNLGGSFLWMVCLIICGLVKLINVFGLVMLRLFSMVKFVEILFIVGLVSMEMYGKLCFCIFVSVVEVFVICISDISVFCICVLLEVEK